MTGVDHVLGGAETSDTTVETESEREPHLLGNVLDEAALLTEGEVGKLEQKIGELESKTGFRVLITTTNSTGGKTSRDYAENFLRTTTTAAECVMGLSI